MDERREKALSLINRAETSISNAREIMEDKKLFHLTGELQAVDTILYRIIKNQRA